MLSSQTDSPADSPDALYRAAIKSYGQSHFPRLQSSRRRNAYFHQYLTKLVRHHALPNARILDIGCANGDMLAALNPSFGVGIDLNPAAITAAKQQHSHNPNLHFHELAAEDLARLPALLNEESPTFDYIILSGTLPQLYDLHTALEALRAVCHDRTRIIVTTFSRLWQPAIRLAELLRWKARVPEESWLPPVEVRSIFDQCDFDIIQQEPGILLPVHIPLVSNLANRWLSPLPAFRAFDLCTLTIARMLPRTNRLDLPDTVSVIVPARNESGNIKPLLDRIPQLGKTTEVIFIEGNSTDDTWPTIQKVVEDYNNETNQLITPQSSVLSPQHYPLSPQSSVLSPQHPPLSPQSSALSTRHKVSCCKQSGRGKGDAVRLGFAQATGDILIILDADISVPPEELPRFVHLLARGQCEFANGSRLVYPMEKQAMQFLNMLANKTFGLLFTFLLGQRLRDTLCGTKVLRKSDYEKIVHNRAYFGDFDPFGDFDLLFGAARLSLKITDVPVHYKQRTYGSTNISRFRHGLLLLRMCAFAARKIKFI